MDKFIGQKLNDVTGELQKIGMNFEIIDNNFSVEGDTKLVTNIIMLNGIVKVYTGNFIFDVKNKEWEKK